MSLFFISAASGTGKTTLMKELQKREIEAHDTDVDCIRRSRITGNPLTQEQARVEGGYDWIYPLENLRNLKKASSSRDVFLFGNVDNFQEIKDIADDYIWMDVPLDVLNERLDKRTKEYGKSDTERGLILSVYKEMKSSIDPDVFTLDATKPVELIADDLLNHVNKSSK